MRVLLRNRKTGQYLDPGGSWTGNTRSARAFLHSAEAVHVAYSLNLENVDICMEFSNPAYDVRVPLTGEVTAHVNQPVL